MDHYMIDCNPTDTRTLTLTKHHGLGNDFLVYVDPSVAPEGAAQVGMGGDPGADSGFIGPDVARALCDRHRGLGADGLIWSRALPPRGEAIATFRLWNADGSEAETSGNGLRCLGQALVMAGMAPVGPGTSFGVATPVGVKRLSVRPLDPAGLVWASVDMGEVRLLGPAERCNVGHGQMMVDVGNPHLVVLGADPATVDVANLGPAIEATEPGGLNVEFVALGPGRDELTMRVWERGVGETLACGSGAVAAAAAMHRWGKVGTKVTVQQLGGAAVVDLSQAPGATLSGPSQLVATCTVDRAIVS